MAALQRDPVSVQFDAAAARLLKRAAANHGGWVGTYVKNPSPAWMLWGARHGINLLGPDNAVGGRARTRWCRGFIRSVYYLHQWHWYQGRGLDLTDKRTVRNRYPSLQYQVGTVRINPDGVVVGRAVRIRFLVGDARAAREAARRQPASERIFTDSGAPGPKWADPSVRDWR